MNLKAQVTVEFMIVLVILLSVLLFSLLVFGEKQSGFILSREQFLAKLEAGKIAGAANAVFLAGNGAKTTIVLEKSFDYSVEFLGNSVNVKWKDTYQSAPLLTSNATAPPIVSGSKITVKNSNGALVIENA